MADLEICKLAVCSISTHHEAAVTPEEAAFDPVLPEACPRKVAEHAGFGGHLHGQRMMRTLPGSIFCLMTALADWCADVSSGRYHGADSGYRVGGRRRYLPQTDNDRQGNRKQQ